MACTVKEITPDAVKFSYPNEDLINSVYKNTIQKIVFKSGRVQVFAESTYFKTVNNIDDYDNGGQKSYSYNLTDIAFSPSIVGGATLNFLPFKNYELSLISKYVSKEYLDNAQQEDRKLNAYYVQNLRMMYTVRFKEIKEMNLIFQLNNVFNKKYEPNGYTYSYIYGGQLITENFLFPMATTNFMFAVNIKL